MPPPTDPERRERILCEARQLLSDAEGKSWRELAARKEAEQIFAEPLPLEELLQSPMSYPFRLPRSRSADWSSASKDSYLSRWSRENTPTACAERYSRDVRRSYTPVREIADSKVIEESRRPYSSYSKRTPIGFMTLPYRTSINYAEEEQPIRKYDVFQVRSWSYPIYKYLNHREHNYERPYSLTRAYGTTPSYTTPTMTIDSKSRIDGRRGYSGYAYVGLESNFDITSRPRSLTNNNFWRSHYASSPWLLPRHHYTSSALRHFNAYRPTTYNRATVHSYWKPYY
ncbi:unnamed protein product, partial [Mesorhabditis belari]|uniref:Uncharacterized protein n=1 Tax=Mesorhabditis belari TaxID=2138241 RepID=A0AAF3E9L6_9BILA